MGEANARGTYEERRAAAADRAKEERERAEQQRRMRLRAKEEERARLLTGLNAARRTPIAIAALAVLLSAKRE